MSRFGRTEWLMLLGLAATVGVLLSRHRHLRVGFVDFLLVLFVVGMVVIAIVARVI